jgi:hypothetical protein
LADNNAQNGVLFNGANVSGDRLHLDGKDDRFEVDGNDNVFEKLTEGTIEIQFVTDDDKGMLLSRGEDHTKSLDGLLTIEVYNGAIKVEHIMPGGTKVKLESDKDFFDKGETVKVAYSWDENGAKLVVTNDEGEVQTVTVAQTGLTLNVGDDDDESFTIGALEEKDGGPFKDEFKGSIDYVAIYNKADPNPAAPEPTPDFIVEGTSGAEVIDAAYTGDPEGDMIDADDNATGGNEDLVDAGAGNDTIIAGAADDTVFAGSGDDSVLGGAGNDVIYGDSSLGQTGPAKVRESFEWDNAPDPNGGDPIDNGDPITGFSQNTGNVTVKFSLKADPGVINRFETSNQNVAGIDSG